MVAIIVGRGRVDWVLLSPRMGPRFYVRNSYQAEGSEKATQAARQV
jgi:hypothetical protein